MQAHFIVNQYSHSSIYLSYVASNSSKYCSPIGWWYAFKVAFDWSNSHKGIQLYMKLILCSPNGNAIYFLNQWNSWLVNLKPPLFMHAATLLGWHTCLTIIKVMSITLASFPTVSGTLCRKADLRTEGGANVGTLAELRTFLSYTKYKWNKSDIWLVLKKIKKLICRTYHSLWCSSMGQHSHQPLCMLHHTLLKLHIKLVFGLLRHRGYLGTVCNNSVGMSNCDKRRRAPLAG